MRILHCGKFYPPHRGGMETFLGQLAQAQAQAGDEVLVLAHGDETAYALPATPGLSVRRAPVSMTLGGYAPVALSLPFLYLRSLRRFRPDVIHVHAPNGAALWPALARLAHSAPLVLHWHADVGFPPDKAPPAPLLACWRLLEALVLRQADAIIATSQAYLDASQVLALHRAKCRVTPLGLAEPPGPPVPSPTDADHPALRFLDSRSDLRVLAVGRLAHYKGFDVLLKALRAAPGASLCIVGEGEERASLAALAAHPELRGRVHLAGAVPEAVLDACYRRSQVLCLPSLTRSEAFGVVLLEAMSRGVPCLAANVPGSGMAEVLDQGRAGLLVSPGSALELATGLNQLASAPALRQRLGQSGRERFATRYAMPQVARSIRAVYEETLAVAN
jgi:glycosyltransferase involved in cell wall biosynthesis